LSQAGSVETLSTSRSPLSIQNNSGTGRTGRMEFKTLLPSSGVFQ